MTMIRTTKVRLGLLPVAVLALLVAGCGTQRAGDNAGTGGPSQTAVASPSTRPLDFPCPGEDPTPVPSTTTATPSPTGPPTDHYAENHGFMVPFPLHGRARCDGLAAVRRIREALEPLRERGDFDPQSTLNVLSDLGYTVGKTRTYQNGSTGVGFLIEAPSMCLEGTLNRDTTQADAFNGYPDSAGCDRPSGGH